MAPRPRKKPHHQNDLKAPRKRRKPRKPRAAPAPATEWRAWDENRRAAEEYAAHVARGGSIHGVGLTPGEAAATAARGAKAAAAWAAPRVRAGAAWAAPHVKAGMKAAAQEAAVLAKRADPHVRAGLRKVPRKVWIGLGVVAVAGLGWFLWDNRDRNPQTDKPTFVRKLWAAMAGTNLSAGAKRLVIAQFALESGWGYARAAVKGFNYGNITAGAGSWTGPITWAPDKHCVLGGAVCIPIYQRFRKYESDAEAIQDYLAFLGTVPRYARSFQALKGGDLVTFATQLREDGYYTASVDVYVRGMQGAMSVIDAALNTMGVA